MSRQLAERKPAVDMVAVPESQWQAIQRQRPPEALPAAMRPRTRVALWLVAIVGGWFLALKALAIWQESIRASVEIARSEAEVALAQASAASSTGFDAGPGLVILITLGVVALICIIVR